MKRKKPSKFEPVGKARQQALRTADSLTAKAHALGSAGSPNTASQRSRTKQAALFHEAAARAYARGGLGLLARRHWAAAGDCYRQLGDEAGTGKCDRLHAAIPTYWDDDGSPPTGVP